MRKEEMKSVMALYLKVYKTTMHQLTILEGPITDDDLEDITAGFEGLTYDWVRKVVGTAHRDYQQAVNDVQLN